MDGINQINRVRSLINNYTSTTDSKHKCDLLRQLKLMILTFSTLPPTNKSINIDEYILAREIFELEMENSLNNKNEREFELAYLKIKQFYFDFKNILIRSNKMLYFVGLYLLHLLANNRTTDFCMELELLDIPDLTNEYVRVSRDLEQSIMEGNYKNVFSIHSHVNNPHYNYYLDKFDDAIRFQIARSSEKSFDSLRITDAIILLNLKNQEQLIDFIKYENETNELREINWYIIGDRLYFNPIDREKTSIPANRIIEDTVSLAIELEKII